MSILSVDVFLSILAYYKRFPRLSKTLLFFLAFLKEK